MGKIVLYRNGGPLETQEELTVPPKREAVGISTEEVTSVVFPVSALPLWRQPEAGQGTANRLGA